jgi:hypothetical protein
MPPYLKNTISIYKRKTPVAPPSKKTNNANEENQQCRD